MAGRSKLKAEPTVSVKVVVFVTPPPVATILMGIEPEAVEAVVARLSVLVHVGTQEEVEVNEAVTPAGKGESSCCSAEKETTGGVPVKVGDIVAVKRFPTEEPWVTD